jgi:ATP-dependent RNA/DNA helicase IGHMBP2
MAYLHLDPIPRSATTGEVLRFVAETANIDGQLVGKIQFQPRSVVVEIPDSHAAKIVAAIDGATFRERNLRARISRPPRRTGPVDHFDHLLDLLALESDEEERRVKLAATERRQTDDPFGSTLTGLALRENEFGLGGRLLLTLGRKGRSDALPPNRLQPGSPAQLTQTGVQRPLVLHGVIVQREDHTITIAVDEPDDELPEEATWRLDVSADEASRLRQASALLRAQAAQKDRLAELRAVLLGERPPTFRPIDTLPHTTTLNDVQREAIAFALSANDLAIIHGPPGTGKTTTLVELIVQAVARGDRVLACAPSNAAVDNLLEKLLARGIAPVRLGHPARVAEPLRERALDLLVEQHPIAREAKKLNRQATALFRQADKWTKEKPQPGEKAALRNEARELLADARKMESLAIERILDESSVVCATLTGLDSEVLGRRRYSLAVLDEAAQSVEPACWIPLLRADRVVFAGDPCQLPATVLSNAAAPLRISMMERLMARFGETVSRVLSVQYRMHADIMNFSNTEFYDGKLVAHESVVAHLLIDVPNVNAIPLTDAVVTFIDTAGASFDEELEEDTSSRRNPQEADFAVKNVRAFLASGVAPEDLAVITPYAGQVRLIRERLQIPQVEVDSVDGFQGREKEVIVISFVRSNLEGEIGFLADLRRTNVAMTRARRRLMMIGDSATLCHEPFYQRLIAYCEPINSYATVWEELE